MTQTNKIDYKRIIDQKTGDYLGGKVVTLKNSRYKIFMEGSFYKSSLQKGFLVVGKFGDPLDLIFTSLLNSVAARN